MTSYAETTVSTIKRIDLATLQLALSWSRNPDPAHFLSDFHQLSSDINDIGIQASVIDASGHLVLSNLESTPSHTDLSDREHFRVHQQRAENRLFISRPVLGRVSKRWSVQFTRPIQRDGAFSGVLVVSVSAEALSTYYNTRAFKGDMITSVVKDDGTIIARSPLGSGFVGAVIEHLSFATTPGASVSGIFRRGSPLDGVPRLYGYARLPEYQLSIVSGVPLSEIERPAVAQAIREALLVLLICAGILAMARLADRRIATREREARATLNEKRLLEQRVRDRTRELGLANSELTLAASVLDNTMEGVIVTDADGRILSTNPAFTHITGYRREDVAGRKVSLLKSGYHDPAFYEEMWHSLITDGFWQGEIWNCRKNGEIYLQWSTISRVVKGQDQTLRYVAVLRDITQLRSYEEKLHHQAFHDPLTDLPNRILLRDRLDQAIRTAARDDKRVALMFIDLDGFKVVNDSLGHDVGDSLLVAVAERLRTTLRRADTIARLGGDEFVVVASDVATSARIAEIANKIIAAIGTPMTLKDHDVGIGASIGIAVFPDDGDDGTTLMKAADTAMYRAKAAGRGTFRFFQTGMLDRARDQLNLGGELRAALANDQFRLMFQPQVTARRDRYVGVEALIRWQHPSRGLLTPAAFIDTAEESGIIRDIGAWVLDAAFRQIAAWRQDGFQPGRVAVNVSAKQFDDTLVRTVTELSARYQVPLTALELELTESLFMENGPRVVDTLETLRRQGVTVAVDDFGTGYSSLAYLRRLPIDVLKIDRSFLTQPLADGEDRGIVGMIVALARTLRLTSVAEGVETEGQRAFLARLGCDVIQGFLIAPPMPPDEVPAWVAAVFAPDQDPGETRVPATSDPA